MLDFLNNNPAAVSILVYLAVTACDALAAMAEKKLPMMAPALRILGGDIDGLLKSLSKKPGDVVSIVPKD